LLDSKTTRGSYGDLKLLGYWGLLAPTTMENVYLAPTLGRETKGFLKVEEGPRKKF
jgi:hypothetical protein